MQLYYYKKYRELMQWHLKIKISKTKNSKENIINENKKDIYYNVLIKCTGKIHIIEYMVLVIYGAIIKIKRRK